MPLTTDQGQTPSDIGLFFGFEYSPAFPGKKGDASGATALKRLLPTLSEAVTPVVISKSVPWLRVASEVDGVYLEKTHLETELAFDNRNFVEYELFLSILAEAEALALRRKELLWSSKRRIRAYLESKIRFWFRIFDDYRVHYYVSSNVPHRLDDYIAYRLAKARGVPRLCFYRLPIVPGVMSRLILYRDIGEQRRPILIEELGLREEQLPMAEKRECGHEKGGLSSDLWAVYEACVLKGRSLTDLSSSVPRACASGERSFQSHDIAEPVTVSGNSGQKVRRSAFLGLGRKLWMRFCESVISGLERWGVWRYSEDVRSSFEQERYFLLMLHYQPEASSRPLGGLWADQMHLVKTVAAGLPEGTSLYVKEHPKQKSSPAYRGGKFYRSISGLNGVRLVDSSVGDKLAEHSMGVVTLTGAVAFEALLQGKPAIVMGDSVLSRCRGVYSPNSFSELCGSLDSIAGGDCSGASQRDVKEFFEWLNDYSFQGYLEPYVAPEMGSLLSEEDNIQGLVTLMKGWFYSCGLGNERQC